VPKNDPAPSIGRRADPEPRNDPAAERHSSSQRLKRILSRAAAFRGSNMLETYRLMNMEAAMFL